MISTFFVLKHDRQKNRLFASALVLLKYLAQVCMYVWGVAVLELDSNQQGSRHDNNLIARPLSGSPNCAYY